MHAPRYIALLSKRRNDIFQYRLLTRYDMRSYISVRTVANRDAVVGIYYQYSSYVQSELHIPTSIPSVHRDSHERNYSLL